MNEKEKEENDYLVSLKLRWDLSDMLDVVLTVLLARYAVQIMYWISWMTSAVAVDLFYGGRFTYETCIPY